MNENHVNLEALGLDKAKIEKLLIDKLCSELLSGGELGEEALADRVDREIRSRVDQAVDDLGDKHVLPILEKKLDGLALQATNEWGEKIGEPVTFIEYLTAKAEEFINEPVSTDGLSRDQCKRKGRSWYGKGTPRILQMMHTHMEYSISTAMKKALEEVNSTLAKSMGEACKETLKEVQARLRVNVKV